MFKPLFALLLTLTFACKGQRVAHNENNGQNKLDLIAIEKDGYFYTEKPQTMVIKDNQTLNSFFAQVNKTRKPGLPVPIVNFKKDIILVACMGEQKSIDMPQMDIIEQKPDTIFIGVQMPKKGSNSKTGYPFVVYKMANTDKEIVFKML